MTAATTLSALLADDLVRRTLRTLPHPSRIWGRSSLLDWSEWMVAHADAAGLSNALETVVTALDEHFQ